jgi:hypothetical protein
VRSPPLAASRISRRSQRCARPAPPPPASHRIKHLRALLLAPNPCSAAQRPRFCPRASHTPTGSNNAAPVLRLTRHLPPCLAHTVRSPRAGTHRLSQHAGNGRQPRNRALRRHRNPNQHSNTLARPSSISSSHASSAAHRSAPPAATPSRMMLPPHHRHPHSTIALQHTSSRVLAPSASRPHSSCRRPRVTSS